MIFVQTIFNRPATNWNLILKEFSTELPNRTSRGEKIICWIPNLIGNLADVQLICYSIRAPTHAPKKFNQWWLPLKMPDSNRIDLIPKEVGECSKRLILKGPLGIRLILNCYSLTEGFELVTSFEHCYSAPTPSLTLVSVQFSELSRFLEVFCKIKTDILKQGTITVPVSPSQPLCPPTKL